MIATATQFLTTRYLSIVRKSILTLVAWPLAYGFGLVTWAFHPPGPFGPRARKISRDILFLIKNVCLEEFQVESSLYPQ